MDEILDDEGELGEVEVEGFDGGPGAILRYGGRVSGMEIFARNLLEGALDTVIALGAVIATKRWSDGAAARRSPRMNIKAIGATRQKHATENGTRQARSSLTSPGAIFVDGNRYGVTVWASNLCHEWRLLVLPSVSVNG